MTLTIEIEREEDGRWQHGLAGRHGSDRRPRRLVRKHLGDDSAVLRQQLR
jgi:hypothetical protein